MQFDSPQSSTPSTTNWKQELLNSLTSVSDLQQALLVTPDEANKLSLLGDQFKIRITPYYSQLIKNSPDCPIRKQAIPQIEELDPKLPEWAVQLSQKLYQRNFPWHADAIGDVKNLSAPRITHRYFNRAILHLSSMCAVYCRFCFRKSHLNDPEKTLYEGSLDPAFEYLENHSEIQELILTGGDPLSISDAALDRVFSRIAQIKSIKTIRIHSRMAVTLPSRFSDSLLEIFQKHTNALNLVLVSHFNHPLELTQLSKLSLQKLKKTGITLLNQTVLLKGVNDSSKCLSELFQELYFSGVIPFYLHHPDWTPGTFHFRISIERGQQIMRELRGKLSGPALPEYILDIPQGFGKTPLMDSSCQKVQSYPISASEMESDEIQGALYEVRSPHTRSKSHVKHFYLDLYPNS